MLTNRLPFASMLVASRNDHKVTFERAKFFATAWGSTLVDAGELGHMDSELGVWPRGLVWLGQFIGSPHRGHLLPKPQRSDALGVGSEALQRVARSPLFRQRQVWPQ